MKVELEVKESVMLSIEDYNRLQAELSAERTRRLKAEEALSWYYAHCGGDPSDPSFKYFTQYPRVEEEK